MDELRSYSSSKYQGIDDDAEAYIDILFSKGCMFNIGIFMGWADVAPDKPIPMHILTPAYAACCLWTITYETVYQHQVSIISYLS